MRQVKRSSQELVLRFSTTGNHGLSCAATRLAATGAWVVGLGLWFSHREALWLWSMVIALGVLLALVRPFVPQLYPEVATCIFNKSFNQLTVVHELVGRRPRQRWVSRYGLSQIEGIQVYRYRSGLWGHHYTLMIFLAVPEKALIYINGLSDQVLVQTGNQPVQLLTKRVSYHFFRKTGVAWALMPVAQGLLTPDLGRRVVTHNSMERLGKHDLRRLAQMIEQFVWLP